MAMPIAKRCVIEDAYVVELGIDQLISKLQEDKDRLTKDGWTDLAITLEGDGETEAFGATLWGTRMETDEEAEERASRDAHYAETRARYAELAMLAKNPNLVIMDGEEGN